MQPRIGTSRKVQSFPVVMVCCECGKRFSKRITARTFEVKCPRCGSYDTDQA